MRLSKAPSREDLDKIAEKFTLQTVLNILADYDVVHVDIPPISGKENWGAYANDPPKIWVDTKAPYYTRIRTIIHEFWHAYSDLNDLSLTENQVKYLEKKVDEKLFPHHSHSE